MKKLRAVLRGLRRADLVGVHILTSSRRPPRKVAVTATGLLAVGGLVFMDWLSGPQVGFGLFYALAVMGVTFGAGWVAGAIVAILSSGAGLSARLLIHAQDVSAAAVLWNLGNELAVFAALVLVTHNGRSMLDKLAAQSRIDLLTGVLNVRGVLQAFDRERSRAVRTATPLTIAFMDLDNMKRVNDELGHAEGDEVLKIVASSVVSAIRDSDIFGRVGGDEFALILPDTDENHAVKAIQRVRGVINRRTNAHGPDISVSVGVVTFRHDPPGAADALRAADALMYVAKRAGGDRVVGRVLAWESEPLAEFGVVFDIADRYPSWRTGEEDLGSASA